MHSMLNVPKGLTNALGIRLQPIPAGTFLMGSLPAEEHHSADEGPQHLVRIKRPFYLGVYPVTQAQFETLMGDNPSRFTRARGGGPDHPVTGVSSAQAAEFCALLSNLPAEWGAGRVYELPTEAEWEYACRAGTTTPFHCGASLSSAQANFNGQFPYGGAPPGPFLGRTTPVGSYPPNAWGLFDMHGNVWEWCYGYYYDEEHYRTCPRPSGVDRDRRGEPADPYALRGGCWNSKGWKCRAADRYHCSAGGSTANVGFRVLCRVREG